MGLPPMVADADPSNTALARSAPTRDGNIAIREEFDAARAKQTVEAYDFFIERHPGHPLTKKAKSERAKLLKSL